METAHPTILTLKKKNLGMFCWTLCDQSPLNISQVLDAQGRGLQNQFFPFRYFPDFFNIVKTLVIY